MQDEIKLIKQFNRKFHTPEPQQHTIEVDPDYRDLRIRLMQEELAELIAGMQKGDLENIAKEMADLLYVLFGTISAYGLLEKFPAIFRAVHESNMSKTYVPGEGKAQKLHGYKKADVKKYL